MTVRKAQAADFADGPQYIVGDSREIVPTLEFAPTCIITSPPYFNVRKYPAEVQMGYGQKLEEFESDLKVVFEKLLKKAKRNATMWLIADSIRQNGRLLHLPARFDKAATEAGWTLQFTLIWHKDRTYPWLNGSRLRKQHELILAFTKGDPKRLRVDRLREVDGVTEWWLRYPERYHPFGKAPSDVWFEPIPVQGSWGQGFLRHECPFPPRLVERIIELSTDEEDLVVDPFAGTGIVAAVAHAMGRRGLAIDVAEPFEKHFEKEVRSAVAAWWSRRESKRAETQRKKEAFFRANVGLRAAKMGKVITERLCQHGTNVRGCWVRVSRPRRHMPWASLQITILLADKERAEAEKRALEFLGKPPLSKFGLDVDIRMMEPNRFRRKEMAFLYGDSLFAGAEVSPARFRAMCRDSSEPVLATTLPTRSDDVRTINTKYWRDRLPPLYLREEDGEYVTSRSQVPLWLDI